MTRSSPNDDARPRVIRRSTVVPAGYSDGYLRRARRKGELVVLVPGVYLSTADLPDLGPPEWHIAVVTAAIARLSGAPVVSHRSAAMLLGLLPLDTEQQPIHVTRAAPFKSRRGRLIAAHRSTLAADEVMTISGVPVTTAPRTALDCAFLLPDNEAAVLITTALAGQTTAAALLDQLARYGRVPGIRRVADIVRTAINRDRPDHSPTVISTWAGSPSGPADSQE